MQRRVFLRTFVIGIPALAVACDLGATDHNLPGGAPVSATGGLNQYDLLAKAYNGEPPTDRRFEFQVYRDGDFVSPDPSEFEIGPAPGGAANDRSYDPEETELYVFEDGETVIFYEVFD